MEMKALESPYFARLKSCRECSTFKSLRVKESTETLYMIRIKTSCTRGMIRASRSTTRKKKRVK